MCIVREVDYEEESDISIMPYIFRDTREKRLEILDKLRDYMKFIAETDSVLAHDKFNFFCFGDFLSSDKDIDTIDFYIYADSWHASLISTYIKLYMLNIGLHVVTVEYDEDVSDIDIKAAESMSWLYDDDMSDGFKELLKDFSVDRTSNVKRYTIAARNISSNNRG